MRHKEREVPTYGKRKKTAADVVDGIMNALNLSQKKLADKMGLKAQQQVYNMLIAKNGMRTDNFIKMLDALGYDLIVRNRVTDAEIQVIAGARAAKDGGEDE